MKRILFFYINIHSTIILLQRDNAFTNPAVITGGESKLAFHDATLLITGSPAILFFFSRRG